MLKQTVGESDVIKSLQDEITRYKSLLDARDTRVKELMSNETHAVKIQEEIKRDLEEARKDRDCAAQEVKEREKVIAE